MAEDLLEDRSYEEWMREHKARIEALEKRVDAAQKEASERDQLADEMTKRTTDLETALTRISDIVSQPEVPTGTTTGVAGDVVLSDSPAETVAPPEETPEEPPEKEAPPEEPPEKEEEPPEEPPEEARSEAIQKIADFLKH